MALKNFKPVTPSMRQLVIVDRSELWKGKPVKALTEGLRKPVVATITVISLPGNAVAAISGATG